MNNEQTKEALKEELELLRKENDLWNRINNPKKAPPAFRKGMPLKY